MNGIVRVDYPETYRFLPYAPGTPFIHLQQPLYNFVHPSSWNAVTLTDPSLQLMGANVVRPDGQAVWRRLNLTLSGAFTATDVLAVEIDQMLNNLGIAEPVLRICSLTSPDDTRTVGLITTPSGGFRRHVQRQGLYLRERVAERGQLRLAGLDLEVPVAAARERALVACDVDEIVVRAAEPEVETGVLSAGLVARCAVEVEDHLPVIHGADGGLLGRLARGDGGRIVGEGGSRQR